MCVCMQPIYKCLPLFVSESACFFDVCGEQRVAAVNKNRRRSKTLFTSEGSMGRWGGQTSSEEDSPSYKQGPFSQWWANESDSLFVCVFCLYLQAVLPGWNKDSTASFLVRHFFFFFTQSWTEEFESPVGMCVCVCVFFFFFCMFMWWISDGNFSVLLVLKKKGKKKRKKRHSDTPEFNCSTLKGNKNKDKTLDFPFDEP